MITIKLSGIEGLNKAIQGKITALTEGVDREIGDFCSEVNAEQKRRVPVDKGLLRSSLHVVKVAPLNWTILSAGPGSSYAPYQEWGCGALVSIPPGLEAEAAQFRGKGLRKQNMNAQPFFFAPVYEKKKELFTNIINMLKK